MSMTCVKTDCMHMMQYDIEFGNYMHI